MLFHLIQVSRQKLQYQQSQVTWRQTLLFYVDTATADDTSANQLQISLFCTLVLQSDVGYFFGVGSFFPLFFPLRMQFEQQRVCLAFNVVSIKTIQNQEFCQLLYPNLLDPRMGLSVYLVNIAFVLVCMGLSFLSLLV